MKVAIGSLTACLILTLGCDVTEAFDRSGPQGEGQWTRMPEGPLSARHAAHAFWVDGTLLVIGGTEADPCPPGAGCTAPEIGPRRDGAAFDPGTNEWQRIADAPVPVGTAFGTVVGDRLYLLVGFEGDPVRQAFLSYTPKSDTWRELAPPTKKPAFRFLVPFGDDVVAYESSQERGVRGDLLYDTTSDSWSKLPVDPLAETYDRGMVWTGEEIVLLGIPNVPNPGVKPSIYRAAALTQDLEWRRLPESEVVGSNPVWHFTGGVVVNASTVEVDGGETNNYGRFYPTGGIFDPAKEQWSDLPNPPEHDYEAFRDHVTGIYVGGEAMVTDGNGWALNVPTGDWAALGRPEDGPESEMAAAWMGDRLVIWGGVRWDGSEARLYDDGWIWEPPTR
jgi:hypothetical protein